MGTLWQDLKFGARLLARNPGFTLIAVLTLALGIGANTTIFSWLNAVLLEPVPGARASGELLVVMGTSRAQKNISLSYPDFLDLRERAKSFQGVVAQEESAFAMVGKDSAERTYGQVVSGNFFDVLGVRMLLGRGFQPEEAKTPGEAPVAVISYALWQRRFAGQEDVLGKTITLNNRALTIVGVAPPEFQGGATGLRVDVWVPITMHPIFWPGTNYLGNRDIHWFTGLARLKPGVTLNQAQAEVTSIANQLAKEFPNTNEGKGTLLYPIWKAPMGAQEAVGPVLLLLMCLVGVVLMIACANVANLLLARATVRRKEIAVRLALGAGRRRLTRQLLTESVMLGLLAGVAGVLIASWTSGLLMTLVPATGLPVYLDLHLNARALGFALALAVLTGLIFGLAPALSATQGALTATLRDEAGSLSGSRGKGWLRNSLVVAQVALSLVLLIAAGLFVRSLQAAQAFNPGFNPQGVLLAGLDLLPNGYDSAKGRQFYEQLQDRLERIPGVQAAALSGFVPLGFGGSSSSWIVVEDYVPARDEQAWSFLYFVGPGYFATMQIPLIRGREFSRLDKIGQPPVVVINETLAKRYWKDRDPVGLRISFSGDQLTIVGVARDSKYQQLNEAPRPMVFLPLLQFYRSGVNIHLRTAGAPAGLATAVQDVVRSIDPSLPVFAIRTLAGHIQAASFQQRLAGNLLGAFGLLAVILAAVGIYGVISYAVEQRTHEIGIRIALGAEPRDILRLVVGQGALLTGIGLALGLGAAFGAARLMASLLFGVSANDPLTFIVLPVALAIVAVLACWIPARRAMRVEPVEALRYE